MTFYNQPLVTKTKSMINNLINLIYNSSDEGRLKVAAQRLGEIPTTESTEVVNALIHLLSKTNNQETRWTATETLWAIAPNNPVCGAKIIKNLAIQIAANNLGLVIAILPKTKNNFSVLVRLSAQNNNYLPSQLKLTLLDEDGENFLQVKSGNQDNCIQVKFTGWPREIFQIKLSLKSSQITEEFAI